MKIYKYKLPSVRGNIILRMHEIKYIMHVQVINNIPFLWACVDPDIEADYTISAIHTGDNAPDNDNFLKTGTAVIHDGRYVLHYFVDLWDYHKVKKIDFNITE